MRLTTTPITDEQRVLEIIQTGKILRREIAAYAGMSERRVRAIIALLIDAGHSIANSGSGYSITNDPEIIEASARRLRSQAFKMLGRAAKLEKNSVREQAGQMVLELEEI